MQCVVEAAAKKKVDMEARTERNDSSVPLTHYRICRVPWTKIVPRRKNFDHQRAKTYKDRI